jgi:hypothetical protein
MGFEHTGSDLNPGEAAEGLSGAWVSSILSKQVNDLTLINTHVKYGPNDLGPSADFGGSNPGGDAGDDAAPNIALLVHKVTNVGGHAGQGRFYIPGLNESMVDTGGVIDGSEFAEWVDVVQDFYENIVALDLTPALLHGESSPVADPTPIESFVVDAKAATQRRRMRR